MITNGTLLSAQTIDMLKSTQIKRLQVTLDGPEEIHDNRRYYRGAQKKSFQIILKGLKECQINKIPVNIRINIDKTNILYYQDLVQFLFAEGLLGASSDNSVSLGLVKPITDKVNSYQAKLLTFEEFGKLLIKFKYYLFEKGIVKKLSFNFNPSTPCGAVNINTYLVSPDGLLKKCWAQATDEKTDIGNLQTGVDSSVPLTIDWHGYDPTLDKKCSQCNLLPVCAGGCPVEMMTIPNLKDQYCPYKKQSIEDNLLLAGIIRHEKREK